MTIKNLKKKEKKKSKEERNLQNVRPAFLCTPVYFGNYQAKAIKKNKNATHVTRLLHGGMEATAAVY